MTDITGRVASLEDIVAWHTQQLLTRPDLDAFQRVQVLWNRQFTDLTNGAYVDHVLLQKLEALYAGLNINLSRQITNYNTFTGGFPTKVTSLLYSGVKYTGDVQISGAGSLLITINNGILTFVGGGAGGSATTIEPYLVHTATAGLVNSKVLTAGTGLYFSSAGVMGMDSALYTGLTGHGGRTDIHFTQSEISIPLSQLSDTANNTPSNNQVLTYNSSTWTGFSLTGAGLVNVIPGNGQFVISGVGSAITNLEDIGNVTDAAPQQFQVLQYGSSAWSGARLTGAGNTTVYDTNGVITISGVLSTGVGANPADTYVTWDNTSTDLTNRRVLTAGLGISVSTSTAATVGLQGSLYTGLTGHTGDPSIHFTQGSISITASQVSDFTEAVQDTVGASSFLKNGTGLVWTYDDANNYLSGNVNIGPLVLGAGTVSIITGAGQVTVSGAASSITTLESLTNVTNAAPANAQFLRYNGVEWTGYTITGAGSVTALLTGSVLTLSGQDTGITSVVFGTGLSGNVSNTTLTISGRFASTSQLGVAQFDPTDFAVSAGGIVTLVQSGITALNITGGQVVKSLTVTGKSVYDDIVITGVGNTSVYLTGQTLYISSTGGGGSTSSSTFTGVTSINITGAAKTGDITLTGWGTTVVSVTGNTIYIGSTGGSSSVTTLESLTNVTNASPASGQVLFYNGTEWTGQATSETTLSGVNGITVIENTGLGILYVSGNSSLEQLNNVTDAAPVSGRILHYNGVEWTGATITGAGNTAVYLSNGVYTISGVQNTGVGADATDTYVTWDNTSTDLVNRRVLTAGLGITVSTSTNATVGMQGALYTGLTGHTGDASIHFTQAAISITSSQVSDFTEAVQDTVGSSSFLKNGTGIVWTYNDASNYLSGNVDIGPLVAGAGTVTVITGVGSVIVSGTASTYTYTGVSALSITGATKTGVVTLTGYGNTTVSVTGNIVYIGSTGGTSNVTTLESLTNVTDAAPSNAQFLRYNGTEWSGYTITGAGSVTSLLAGNVLTLSGQDTGITSAVFGTGLSGNVAGTVLTVSGRIASTTQLGVSQYDPTDFSVTAGGIVSLLQSGITSLNITGGQVVKSLSVTGKSVYDDIVITGVGNTSVYLTGQTLYISSTGGGSSSITTLESLTNVTNVSPVSGQTLIYNGTEWSGYSIGEVTLTGAGTVTVITGATTITISGAASTYSYTGVSSISVTGALKTGDITITGYGTTTVSVTGNIIYIGSTGGSSSVTTLESLTNVTNTSPASGQVLFYNGTEWTGQSTSETTLSGVNGISIIENTGLGIIYVSGNSSLEQLNNVTDVAPVSGKVLHYNGVEWTGATLTGAGNTTVTLANGIYLISGVISTGAGAAVTDTFVTWDGTSADLPNKRVLTAGLGITVDTSTAATVGIQGTLYTGLTGHTGDGSIHFTQASISITSSQVSDFTEAVQDTVGASTFLKNGTGITWTYNDASNYLSGNVDIGPLVAGAGAVSVITGIGSVTITGQVPVYSLSVTGKTVTGAVIVTGVGNTSVYLTGQTLYISSTGGGGSSVTTLESLTNVTDVAPVSGNLLFYDGVQWTGLSSTVGTLTGAGAVVVSTVSSTVTISGQVPVYSLSVTGNTVTGAVVVTGVGNTSVYLTGQTLYISSTGGGGTSVTTLESLTNVSDVAPSNTQFLRYNGVEWSGYTITGAGSVTTFIGSNVLTISGQDTGITAVTFGTGLSGSVAGTTLTISGRLASTSQLGVAQFDAGDFSVSALGLVSLLTSGITALNITGGAVVKSLTVTGNSIFDDIVVTGKGSIVVTTTGQTIYIDSTGTAGVGGGVTSLTVTGLAAAGGLTLTGFGSVSVGLTGSTIYFGGAGGGTITTLETLTNVTDMSPASGQVLFYDGTQWTGIASTEGLLTGKGTVTVSIVGTDVIISGAAGAGGTLEDLTNVYDSAYLASGLLFYDGTQWTGVSVNPNDFFISGNAFHLGDLSGHRDTSIQPTGLRTDKSVLLWSPTTNNWRDYSITGAGGITAYNDDAARRLIISGEWEYVVLTGFRNVLSASNIDMTGFSFSGTPGTSYIIQGMALCKSPQAATGARPGMYIKSWGPNNNLFAGQFQSPTSATAQTISFYGGTGAVLNTVSTAVAVANTAYTNYFNAFWQCGVSGGIFQITLASEAGGGPITNAVSMITGSYISYRALVSGANIRYA